MQLISDSEDIIYGNAISACSKSFYSRKQTSEKLWEGNVYSTWMRLEEKYKMLLIQNHLPAVCSGNVFLVPGQKHLDAITVHTHSLPVPSSSTALLPAAHLPEDMVAMTPGLAGHSSILHTYDPMKPKHTLKELLYSRPSTSGRIFNFKVYLHIYYSTSKSRSFFERL